MTYSFGKWLQRWRKAEDLTQKQLAERAFCSLNTIKKIETDQRRPSRQLAQALAAALRLPPEQEEIFIECARGLRLVDHLALETGGKRETPAPLLNRSPAPLPQPATPLLGRDAEMARLTDLLAHSWLVTIIGPGGMGKTRLALAAAHQQQAMGKNVVFVSLAELESAAHLATAVAQALGLKPSARLSAETQILQLLPAQKLLLVLDNFEHLLDGVGLLLTIRQAAPGVTFLVTSREPLQLPGEQLYPLTGLACPPPDSSEEANRFPAAQLFLQSARRLVPNLVVTDSASLRRLCQLTEGMPLALELAAGWANTLTLPDIVAELEKSLDILRRSRPERNGRHHSIRVVFDATWQLLPPAEREAFARLSVFRGGFTRETAAAVAHITLPHLSALTGRRWLALDYGNGRYHIHELLRQYGLEKLAAQNELEPTRAAHFAVFASLAQTADSHLRGSEQIDWLRRLDQETDNLRAALNWALVQPQYAEQAAGMALALCWYWRIRSRVIEGRAWLRRIRQEAIGDRALLAAITYHAGHFAWMQADYDRAMALQEASLSLWHSLAQPNLAGLALTRHTMGMTAHHQGNFAAAEAHFQASLDLFTRAKDAWGMAFTHQWLGANCLRMGDVSQARAHLERGLELIRPSGDKWVTGLLLTWLAELAWQEGELAQAARYAEEACRLQEAVGHVHSLAVSWQMLAQIAQKTGDMAAARRYYLAALDIYEKMGNRPNMTIIQAALDSLPKS